LVPSLVYCISRILCVPQTSSFLPEARSVLTLFFLVCRRVVLPRLYFPFFLSETIAAKVREVRIARLLRSCWWSGLCFVKRFAVWRRCALHPFPPFGFLSGRDHFFGTTHARLYFSLHRANVGVTLSPGVGAARRFDPRNQTTQKLVLVVLSRFPPDSNEHSFSWVFLLTAEMCPLRSGRI